MRVQGVERAGTIDATRYAYWFFWHASLPMLYLNAPPLIEKVVVEHRDGMAIDDVTVFYTGPGIGDGECRVRADFYQVKFQGEQEPCLEYTDLLDPAWTGAGQSVLWRFCEQWQRLRERESGVRLSLVTNLPWSPEDVLAPLLHDRGILDDPFFTMGSKTALGRAGREWREHLTMLDDTAFLEFIQQIRLWPTPVSLKAAENRLAERCALAGLAAPDFSGNVNAYEGLARRLVAHGRQEVTPPQLSRIIQQEGLIATARPPFQSTCAIRSIQRPACVPEVEARLTTDLSGLSMGRDPIDPAVWSEISSRIRATAAKLDALGRPQHLVLDTHLNIGWLAGTIFGARNGLILNEKRDGEATAGGTSAVRADTDPGWQFSVERVGEGNDLALAISTIQDIGEDVRRSLEILIPAAGCFVAARLPSLGEAAIRNGSHASALAEELIGVLRIVAQAREVSWTHLFADCPVELAFFIGQRSAGFGPMTFYEVDPRRTRMFRPTVSSH